MSEVPLYPHSILLPNLAAPPTRQNLGRGRPNSISPERLLFQKSTCVSTDAAKTDYSVQHSGVIVGVRVPISLCPPPPNHPPLLSRC